MREIIYLNLDSSGKVFALAKSPYDCAVCGKQIWLPVNMDAVKEYINGEIDQIFWWGHGHSEDMEICSDCLKKGVDYQDAVLGKLKEENVNEDIQT